MSRAVAPALMIASAVVLGERAAGEIALEQDADRLRRDTGHVVEHRDQPGADLLLQVPGGHFQPVQGGRRRRRGAAELLPHFAEDDPLRGEDVPGLDQRADLLLLLFGERHPGPGQRPHTFDRVVQCLPELHRRAGRVGAQCCGHVQRQRRRLAEHVVPGARLVAHVREREQQVFRRLDRFVVLPGLVGQGRRQVPTCSAVTPAAAPVCLITFAVSLPIFSDSAAAS
jgi:hypothetical protein